MKIRCRIFEAYTPNKLSDLINEFLINYVSKVISVTQSDNVHGRIIITIIYEAL